MIICKSCFRKDQKVIARGLCNSCYLWNRKNGTLDNPLPYNPPGKGSGGGRKSFPIGTRRRGDDGYVFIKMKADSTTKRRGWELEHRVVMESILDRSLLPEENVHHKNGIRDDNRPENLELWHEIGKQPKGVRIRDLIDYIADHYADEMLAAIESRTETAWH